MTLDACNVRCRLAAEFSKGTNMSNETMWPARNARWSAVAVRRSLRGALCAAVVAATAACGGGASSDAAGGNPPPSGSATYQPAPVGTPVGTPVTATIDGAGGSLVSADARLTLSIPAGALSGPTAITIQPITNTGPNGSGVAYRLGPEGTTFAVAVTLTFALSGAEALAQDNGLIATQHADGLWYLPPGLVRDAVAHTLSITSTHFSDWAFLQTIYLKPGSQRLRAGTSADFEPKVLWDPSNEEELSSPFGSEVAVMMPMHFSPGMLGHEAARHWAVNGVDGGNTTVGTVQPASDNGHYTAPGSVPATTDFTVSLTVELASRQSVTALATATVYSQERWDGQSDITFTNGTSLHATFTFVQVGDPVDGRYDLDVAEGRVFFHPIETQNGCALTYSETTHFISPGEGSMTVQYSVSSTGRESPMVQGGGATVWPVVMTVACPDESPKDIPSTLGGDWWPVPPTGNVPVQASNGSVTIQISTPTASGTVNLQFQP